MHDVALRLRTTLTTWRLRATLAIARALFRTTFAVARRSRWSFSIAWTTVFAPSFFRASIPFATRNIPPFAFARTAWYVAVATWCLTFPTGSFGFLFFLFR